jgi:hypothetical protein
MTRPFLVLTLALAAAVPSHRAAAQASAPARAEVLVLGVYHMANPGRDLFNMKADDVLAPKRQAEIAELVRVLRKFRPTKIALEADVGSDRVPKRYGEYLAGTHELTSNETEQVGFRLAKEMGHKTVYPVDVEGDFPFQRLQNYAKGSGRAKELDDMMGEVGAMVKAQNDYLASHTVLETLLYMNADEKVASDVGLYYREAHIGQPGDWPGADLVADWFRRNVRIYANIAGLAASPEERIVAVFGAGHLGWLQHDIASDPTLRLRKLAELAK